MFRLNRYNFKLIISINVICISWIFMDLFSENNFFINYSIPWHLILTIQSKSWISTCLRNFLYEILPKFIPISSRRKKKSAYTKTTKFGVVHLIWASIYFNYYIHNILTIKFWVSSKEIIFLSTCPGNACFNS